MMLTWQSTGGSDARCWMGVQKMLCSCVLAVVSPRLLIRL